eukprot:CCRYP_004017-RA/>CCRYP_004017-RA protein AED:0.24 eAED:0.24 QI:148/1/1/1/1/1/6/1023/1015
MKAVRTQSHAGIPIRRPPASSDSLVSEMSTDSRTESRRDPYGPSTNSSGGVKNPARTAQILLAMACLWPLLLLLLPPANSSAGTNNLHADIDHLRSLTSSRIAHNLSAKTQYLRDEMSSLLHRTDVVGYGPNKPRLAVVLVVPPTNDNDTSISPNDADLALKSAEKAIESIFRTADRNRIFVVTVVMDGRGKVGSFESRMADIDAGRTRHRHGGRVHSHDHHEEWEEGHGDETSKEVHAHSEKIYILYNHETRGVVGSRKRGVHFTNVLARKHEEAGLKSNEEDLIVMFLRCDGMFREEDDNKRTWLDDVTDALIVGYDGDMNEEGVAQQQRRQQQQPANAVSFTVDFTSTDTEGNLQIHPFHPGQVQSFNFGFHPMRDMATAQQMALGNGESYPTPLLLGGATAMRLETYNSLPASDDKLMNNYGADLEMSFNLWMCADGIDVLVGASSARVLVDPQVLPLTERAELSGPLIARIVSTWMSGHGDDVYADAFLDIAAKEAAIESTSKAERGDTHGIPKDNAKIARALEEETKRRRNLLVRISEEAKHSTSLPSGIGQKCRPFSWFAEHVVPNLMLHEYGDAEAESDVVNSEIREVIKKRGQKILPSKPLDEARMAIIAKASPVKLAYVDVSGQHMEHPHKGALDEKGNFGYVHDETFLAKSPPAFEFKNDSEKEKLCKKGDPNYIMLTERVFVDLTSHEAAEKRAEHGLSLKKRAKIFCLVYTIEKFHDRIPAIKETWGKKCDGFMVASTKTDVALGTVAIPHEGPEEYNNIWQKVRSMWSYIYDNYYEKYDFFHIGGDDLYLIVENLRLYLESEEIQLASNGGQYLPDGSEDSQTPLFLGRRFAEGGDRDRMFISGGSGYTMNKGASVNIPPMYICFSVHVTESYSASNAFSHNHINILNVAALKTLVVDGFPTCFPHLKTFSEDVMVATCLRKMDILPYDTKDEAGGERYMPFQPGHHLTYRPPKNPKDDWYSNYSVDVKWGIDHCAAKSVAFHYIKEDLMRRMHAILYHYC